MDSLLFKAEMIRAIQNTRPGVWPAQPVDPALPFKWQTRRVMSDWIKYPHLFSPDTVVNYGDGFAHWVRADMRDSLNNPLCVQTRCPYGSSPGNRLWVKETHHLFAHGDPTQPGGIRTHQVVYRADNEGYEVKWRPSIFMPRWASRFDLEIKAVRVERVQQISEADAVAEGVEKNCKGDWQTCPGCLNSGAGACLFEDEYIHYQRDLDNLPAFSAIESYQSLWDKINGKRSGCSWDSNPWVWVIEFMVK